MELFISFLVISIIGTVLHFTYELSGHNKYVAIFSAVNESTWEHIKIGLSPMLLWGLFDGFKYGSNQNYFFAKSLSLLILITIVPVLFYGYKIFTKKSFLIIDILIFYIAIFAGEWVFYYVINNLLPNYILGYIGCILLFIIFGFYLLLTLWPIKNELFIDPITKKYGIKGHSHNHD